MINPYITLASCYGLLDRMEEAKSAGKELLRLKPDFTVRFWVEVMPCLDKEMYQRFGEALRKAGLPD